MYAGNCLGFFLQSAVFARSTIIESKAFESDQKTQAFVGTLSYMGINTSSLETQTV